MGQADSHRGRLDGDRQVDRGRCWTDTSSDSWTEADASSFGGQKQMSNGHRLLPLPSPTSTPGSQSLAGLS